MQPKSQKYFDCLQQHFGLTAFKPLQWQIIRALTAKQRGSDVCAIIATGYGKSLSYQFPAFYLNKVVVVISPLIALMEDQVSALNKRGECACLLGTAQQDADIKERILALHFKLVYATPEYITRGNGLKLLRDLGPSLALIAVDEAHCISKWGHEFRPAYRQLSQLRVVVPQVRLLALTGTATRRVRDDICEQLLLRRPQLLNSSLDRPNLELTVRPKGASLASDLQPYLSWAAEAAGATIVYSNTIRDTEHMARQLELLGVRCHSYHSKLPLEAKRRHQQDFAEDRVRAMAATTAFGMGIDKRNVRLVVHYGAPSDMERYYQEIGRAGRDGLAAKCVLFYGDADAATHRRLQHRLPLTPQRSEELLRLASAMADYTQTSQCRRQFILHYFEERTPLRWRSNCCDNCRKARHVKKATTLPETPPAQLDVSREARLLLAMLRQLNGRIGLGKLLLALRGSRSKCLSSLCREHENFGSVAHRSLAWLKALAEHLKALDYIRDEYQRDASCAFGYPMPQVTLRGCCWLDKDSSELADIFVDFSSRLGKLHLKQQKRGQPTKAQLDWGSDIDVDELDGIIEQEQELQLERELGKEQQQLPAWGPDIDIDFEQLDAAIAKSSAPVQDDALESLLVDCQQILREEREEKTRTLKARKRVWQFLEGSYQKRPLIPKFKYGSRATD